MALKSIQMSSSSTEASNSNNSKMSTKEAIQDLYDMGFIQESEYRSRLAAIGVDVPATDDTPSHPLDVAAPALVSSRDRLVASFDSYDNVLPSGTTQADVGGAARRPFLETNKCEQGCLAIKCDRCGAQVMSCATEE